MGSSQGYAGKHRSTLPKGHSLGYFTPSRHRFGCTAAAPGMDLCRSPVVNFCKSPNCRRITARWSTIPGRVVVVVESSLASTAVAVEESVERLGTQQVDLCD